jgi:hypothetical protein
MPIPVINQAIRVDVYGTFQGQSWQNVLNIKRATAGVVSSTNLADLETFMNTSGSGGTGLKFLAGLYGGMDSGLATTKVTLTTYNGADSLRRDTALSAVGTSADTDEGAYLALVVRLQSAFASRRKQGRIFLPGVNRGMLDATNKSLVDASFRSGAITRMTNMANGLLSTSTDEYALAVLSRVGESIEQATTLGVDSTIGLQRRRRQ